MKLNVDFRSIKGVHFLSFMDVLLLCTYAGDLAYKLVKYTSLTVELIFTYLEHIYWLVPDHFKWFNLTYMITWAKTAI